MAAESIRSSFIMGDRLQASSSSAPSSSGSSWSSRDSNPRRRRMVVRASNCHLVLGLNHTASKQEIKRAYRSLALQYHPDVCKGTQSEHLFTQINLAYESLMNNLQSPTSTPQDFPGSSCRAQDEWLSEGYTFEEIFGENPRYQTVEEEVFEELNTPRSKSTGRKYKNRGREDW